MIRRFSLPSKRSGHHHPTSSSSLPPLHSSISPISPQNPPTRSISSPSLTHEYSIAVKTDSYNEIWSNSDDTIVATTSSKLSHSTPRSSTSCRSTPSANPNAIKRSTFSPNSASSTTPSPIPFQTHSKKQDCASPYVLNNDLDTIDRLVARLHGVVESDKVLVKIGLERGRDRYPIQEVVKQLRKNHHNFLSQLKDLEEHVCLCFATVNRARSLLLQEIHLQENRMNSRR